MVEVGSCSRFFLLFLIPSPVIFYFILSWWSCIELATGVPDPGFAFMGVIGRVCVAQDLDHFSHIIVFVTSPGCVTTLGAEIQVVTGVLDPGWG